jgi:hypothetical protein
VVAERKATAAGVYPRASISTWPYGAQLRELLYVLFGDEKVELHHRPALCNRQRSATVKGIVYDPPANDPDYLVYLPADEHDIETRVRGQHGQHSDLALARKRKRAEKKANKQRIKAVGYFLAWKRRQQRKAKRLKTHWPKRKLRSANRWPKKKLRGD